MCRVCNDRFNIHEKIAAHDFIEQMREFYGLAVKEPRKRRLTKKSLLSRIENELMRLQIESDKNHVEKLQNLMAQEIDLQLMNEQFNSIMQEYYQLKLREE